MTPLLLFAAVAAGGLRFPWAWTAFAVLSWGALYAAPRRARLPGAAFWGAALAWAGLSAAASPEPLVSAPALAYAATAWAWLELGAADAAEGPRALGVAALVAVAVVAALAAALVDVPAHRGAGLLFPYYNYTAAVVAAAGSAAAAGPAALAAGGAAGAAAFLVWTGSRGGLAALAAGAALASWRAGRRRPVAVAAAAAAAFLLVPSGARDALLKTARPGSHQRPAIWAAAVAASAERPLTGWGPGRFSRAALLHPTPAPRALTPARFVYRADRAHSAPLDAAVEAGWPCLLLLLAGLAAAWRARPDAGASPASDSLLAAAAALLTHASADSLFALPALSWLAAWCVGAACARPAAPAPPRRGVALAGLAAAALAWGPPWWTAARADSDPAAALRAAPLDAGLWESLARRRLRAGDADGALSALARASSLAPYAAAPRVMAGELLRAAGRWTELRDVAEETLALEPACGQAALQKAESEWRLGRGAEAAAALGRLDASEARPLGAVPPGSRDAAVIGFDAARRAALMRELGLR